MHTWFFPFIPWEFHDGHMVSGVHLFFCASRKLYNQIDKIYGYKFRWLCLTLYTIHSSARCWNVEIPVVANLMRLCYIIPAFPQLSFSNCFLLVPYGLSVLYSIYSRLFYMYLQVFEPHKPFSCSFNPLGDTTIMYMTVNGPHIFGFYHYHARHPNWRKQRISSSFPMLRHFLITSVCLGIALTTSTITVMCTTMYYDSSCSTMTHINTILRWSQQLSDILMPLLGVTFYCFCRHHALHRQVQIHYTTMGQFRTI